LLLTCSRADCHLCVDARVRRGRASLVARSPAPGGQLLDAGPQPPRWRLRAPRGGGLFANARSSWATSRAGSRGGNVACPSCAASQAGTHGAIGTRSSANTRTISPRGSPPLKKGMRSSGQHPRGGLIARGAPGGQRLSAYLDDAAVRSGLAAACSQPQPANAGPGRLGGSSTRASTRILGPGVRPRPYGPGQRSCATGGPPTSPVPAQQPGPLRLDRLIARHVRARRGLPASPIAS